MKKPKKVDDRVKDVENAKTEILNNFQETAQDNPMISEQGIKINDTDNSLKAGVHGPTLLEDFLFREKITHFDHERIPERVVHARGSAAHGVFQVYESMAQYTKAAFLQDPAVKTPVFVRFSTVAGSRGSADTVRDVRGFATKFYTTEGNFDIVGNNMPVFFIQDAIKFPDLIHAVKPEQPNEMPQASTAHDTFWDFISLMPESLHTIMWAMSDRAIPRSVAMMEGFGIHTFRFVNAQGKSRFIKWHWKPLKGVHSLVWDEAQKLAGKDPDWLRRDLWDLIEAGDYPEYELGVQIVEEEDVDTFEFDLLDPTKIIPEELSPVRKIGKMTLNRNPENFFAETEQVAFDPGNIVPGIDFSNDPLLQGRLFSYIDTQLTRLGGPNFTEIPINRPLGMPHNVNRDGLMRQTINSGKANYSPNSLGDNFPMTVPEAQGGFVSHAEAMMGVKTRHRSPSFADFSSQARLFWKSQMPVEQQHIIEAFQFELGKVDRIEIRQRMMKLLYHVDPALAAKVAAGIGVAAPTDGKLDELQLKSMASMVEGGMDNEKLAALQRPADGKKRHIETSPALSMENTPKKGISGRRVAILVADGADPNTVSPVKDALEAAGAVTEFVSITRGMPAPKPGEFSMEVNKTFLTASSIMYDAVFIPGGKNVGALKTSGEAIQFVREAFKHCKPIAALGEGVEVLATSNLMDVKLSAAQSKKVSIDKGVISSYNMTDLDEFLQTFIQAITHHRHWEREATKHLFVA